MRGWRDREQFKARVLEWARKLEVEAHAIYIRPMRRKWASCSTAGTLRFNDELLGIGDGFSVSINSGFPTLRFLCGGVGENPCRE